MEKVEMTFKKFMRALNNSADNLPIRFENNIFIDFPKEASQYELGFKNKPILFINCILPEFIFFGHNDYSSIEFINCKGTDVTFRKGRALGLVTISDTKIKNLFLMDYSFVEGFKIINSEIETMVGETFMGKGLEIFGDSKNVIRKLRINISRMNNITVESMHIQEFILKGINTASISITNCRINKLINSALGIKSKLVIDNLQPIIKADSILDLSNCEISHLQILNSNLRMYALLSFIDLNFKKLEFINVKWKTKINSNINTCIREHRFLKNKMAEQGNKVDETFFLAYELNSIRKSIVFTNKINNQVILFFNWFSNFYRLSISLPLLWFVTFNLFFFTTMVHCESLTILENWGKFFLFINPTHRINFLSIELSNFSMFLDFVSRVFSSYFIYQFIQAFRVHSLK